MTEKLLSVKLVADRMGVSERTIWTYRDLGFMPAPVKIRGVCRWREAAINEWIANGCVDQRKAARGCRS